MKPDYAEAYCNRGIAYHREGELENAINDYNKAIQLKPDLAEAYCNRGNANSNKGDFDSTINDYTKAIDLNSDDAEVYNDRGVAYMAKGDFENAINDYNKVIQLKPDLAEAYCNRGEAWLHLQKWGKAKLDLTTAKNLGVNIIASFHNDYASVEDFEQKHNVKLPEDIAAMLTPPQA